MARIHEQPVEQPEQDEPEHVEGETKSQAFTRLAQQRTRKALKMISLLGNLSSAQYESTPEQIDKIERALYAQCKATMDKLRKVKQVAADFEL